MFKNALIYRIEDWTPPSLTDMEERLSGARFVECGATQPESAGWVAPRGDKYAALAESVGGQVVFKLCTETRAVPGGVVKTQVQAQLDTIEHETGRRPKGKRVREVKEAVVHALLPRAFPKRADTLVWLDPLSQRVWVGAGSTKKADAVVTRLIELLGGGLKLGLLQTTLAPATAMSMWLAEKEAPAGFTIDRECELKQPDSEKASVRYARHTLDIDEVAEHIKQGKLPTQLAMTWNGRVSFVLTEALTLKKIRLLDIALESAAAAPSATGGSQDDGGFDADVAISTGELRQLLPALIEALGGLQVRQGVASATAVSGAATSATSTTTNTDEALPPWETAPA